MNGTRSRLLVVAKFELPIVARQSDGAGVDFPAVHFVQLQFFARTEVMETLVNKKIFFVAISFYCFFLILFFINFSYYTGRRKTSCFFF